MRLWQLSVVTRPAAEDAVSALLERIFQAPPTVYASHLEPLSTVTVFLPLKPHESAVHGRLDEALKDLRRHGLDPSPGTITLQRLPKQDWAESWKKHFKTLDIRGALLIKPPWIRSKARPGRKTVILNPGLSFGTGQHPTTAFCLDQLVQYRRRDAAFLDAGTGSGILAIAAAKLGYHPILAFDFDPQSVRIAAANARRNRVEHRMQIRRQDLARLRIARRSEFDIICANLLDDLLHQEAKRLLTHLRPNGVLVLAGILEPQFAAVQKRYEKEGLRLVGEAVDQEWHSGTFQRPAA